MENKKNKIILAAAFIFIFLFSTAQVSAQTFEGVEVQGCGFPGFFSKIPTCLIAWGSLAISAIMGFFFGIFLMFASWLVGFALDLNFKILDGSNTLITIGWSILRDLANIGFVLVIIIIALATILRREQYGAKKLLPKLITAAIVVNFSLTIAGVFVDFSHVLTKFFLSKIDDNPVEVAKTMAGVFQPQRFYIDTSAEKGLDAGDAIGQVTNYTTTLLNSIVKSVFIVIFLSIAVFTMLVFAFMLLLRYLNLSFLLLTSPIIWLYYVIPGFSKQFNDWWRKFLDWVFFAPSVGFFIYLSLFAAKSLNENEMTVVQNASGIFGATATSIQSLLINAAEMIVITGILIIGLITSKSVGGEGSKKAIELVNKAQKGATNWANERTKNLGRRAMVSGLDSKGQTSFERLGDKRIFGRELRTIPVAGRAFTGISGLSTKAKSEFKKGTEDQQKKFEGRSKEDLVAIALRTKTPGLRTRIASPQELSALAIAAAKKGKGTLEEIMIKDPTFEVEMVDALKRTGMGDQILRYKPEYAGRFGKTIEQTMSKVDDKDILEFSNEQFALEDIAINLNPSHIIKLGTNGRVDQKQTVLSTLTKAIGQEVRDDGRIVDILNEYKYFKKQLETYKNNISDAQARGDKKAVEEAQRLRNNAQSMIKTLKRGLKEQQRKALEKYEKIEQNVNWQDSLYQEEENTSQNNV